jgi:ATP-dependent helicase HrpB
MAKVDLMAAVRGMLNRDHLRFVEAMAPTHLTVPSGSRIAVQYGGEEPVLAVKLQELFGLGETPAVAGGRVPVLLHLLSPAGRPIQVTRDLKGFWNGAYREVKKELKGRYPRHPWPDDPWSAQPTKRTTRAGGRPPH